MEMIRIATLLITLSSIAYSKPYSTEADPVCGYDSCHAVNQSQITVHIVPHSHDDVGWLNTVDQYYYQEVQHIISSVVASLLKNPDRRFIQVETAFLYKWWKQQTDTTKAQVRQLINEGRLEIVNGAWSMNDEAVVHYQSTIDQYTLALRFLEENLGKCARPRIGWQIDAFGHGREHASLLSQFDMEGVFFARFDYRDRKKRLLERKMEMLWTGSANLGSDSNIFTSVLYNHYSCPSTFCFDLLCQDSPIVTDQESIEYNWGNRVFEFKNFIEQQLQYYPTNNILITMGDDFQWQAAEIDYRNIDLIIEGFKVFKQAINGADVNVIYSTPSCYTKAVNDYIKANNITLDVKTDDFFPYASDTSVEWTGYYTSRASSKRLERLGNNLLQVARQMTTFGKKPYETNYGLSQAMGVMQHHDAITGTEHDDVEKDYHKYLVQGMNQALSNISDSFASIMNLSQSLNLKSCLLSNVSICSESANNEEYNVLIYNPLARTTSHYIQIPVTYSDWKVTDPSGVVVENSITEPIREFDYINNETILPSVLIFRAENLPPLGYKVYRITKSYFVENKEKEALKAEKVDQWGFLENYVNFDLDTGLLKSITLSNVTIGVKQQLMYYKSNRETSNAYIFRPDSDERDAIEFGPVENIVLSKSGNVVREVMQVWKDWATQIIRIYPEEDYIEFDWLVGPLDGGVEIISRYTTDLDNPHDDFYTDSSGREMIYRKKNYRPTYNYTDEEPQSGNYYPVTSKMLVKNDDKEFAVLTDRAQGGSSLSPGEVELMLHRAIIDNLNEIEFDQPLVVRGTHYVTAGISSQGIGGRTMAAVERDIAQRKLLQPWVFFTTDDIPVKEQSFLNKELPPNVHLLTLENWNITEDTVLIRLEHIFEKDEDPELSKEVTVDVSDLFKQLTIVSLKEYTLAANIPLEESSRLTWPQLNETESESSPLNKKYRLTRADTDLEITLAPMQIRTFIATIKHND